MKNIIPHLWFNNEAIEAAEFYTRLISNSRITNISTIYNVPTPDGKCDIVSFELLGFPFMAINGGPEFKFNPSISFIINFDSMTEENPREALNALWDKLAENGNVLMPLDRYPFSDSYGWIEDKYGLSWQLILSKPTGENRPKLIPSLLFASQKTPHAEAAAQFYVSIFKDSKMGFVARYPKDETKEAEHKIMFCDFALSGQWFAAMDNIQDQAFNFNEAVSFLIPCETQSEIDYYWQKLSADPTAEQCGWLKDKFGVSWQVWPTILGEMLNNGSAEQKARVTQAFLKMKKFDIAALQKAFQSH